jgi:hypothetical protein
MKLLKNLFQSTADRRQLLRVKHITDLEYFIGSGINAKDHTVSKLLIAIIK